MAGLNEERIHAHPSRPGEFVAPPVPHVQATREGYCQPLARTLIYPWIGFLHTLLAREYRGIYQPRKGSGRPQRHVITRGIADEPNTERLSPETVQGLDRIVSEGEGNPQRGESDGARLGDLLGEGNDAKGGTAMVKCGSAVREHAEVTRSIRGIPCLPKGVLWQPETRRHGVGHLFHIGLCQGLRQGAEQVEDHGIVA
jgi:hypothetical protein